MAADEQCPLSDWRQGDLVLTQLKLPIVQARDGDNVVVGLWIAKHGIAVVSQSCDVVRDIENCPYVQVAPLVEVDEKELQDIKRRKRPRLAFVPGLEGRGLAIDLDACATVSKQLLAGENRVPGCPADEDQVLVGRALARHRGRFAFPNDFNCEVAEPVSKWFSEKYKKHGPNGDLVRSIVEVRVKADSWEKPTEITFYLYRSAPLPPNWPSEWHEALKTLAAKASKSKKYPKPDFILTTFADESAADYRATVELDWDGLSPG